MAQCEGLSALRKEAQEVVNGNSKFTPVTGVLLVGELFSLKKAIVVRQPKLILNFAF